jgi:hypothetical protein
VRTLRKAGLPSSGEVEVFLNPFEENVPEDETHGTVYVRMPASLKRQIEAATEPVAYLRTPGLCAASRNAWLNGPRVRYTSKAYGPAARRGAFAPLRKIRCNMSVRKRTWKTAAGEERQAWLCDYSGQSGKRHVKTFVRKKDAEAFIAKAKVEVSEGAHTADSDSVTIRDAADLWLTTSAARGLERATLAAYEQHARSHIVPSLGRVKLASREGGADTVFVSSRGHIRNRSNIVKYALIPAIVKYALIPADLGGRRDGRRNIPGCTAPPFLRIVVHQSAGG